MSWWHTRRARRRTTDNYLLTGEKPWERFEVTAIAARDYSSLADGEAILVEECRVAGRSVEFVASSAPESVVRFYRIMAR